MVSAKQVRTSVLLCMPETKNVLRRPLDRIGCSLGCFYVSLYDVMVSAKGVKLQVRMSVCFVHA